MPDEPTHIFDGQQAKCGWKIEPLFSHTFAAESIAAGDIITISYKNVFQQFLVNGTPSKPTMSIEELQAVGGSRETAQPTAEGKRRYEPDGYYEGEPCTCSPKCKESCKGTCGCKACRAAYADFLSSDRD